MENVTTQSTTETPSTVAAIELPSEKHINYLIKEATANAATPEEAYRRLAELAWQHAKTDNRKRVPVKELVSNYLTHTDALTARIVEAQEVIRNTLHKLYFFGPIPPEFAWVWGNKRENIQIQGVFRFEERGERLENITRKIQDGSYLLRSTDVIKFTATGYYSNTAAEGQLEVQYLGGDPIAVAQMVRRTHKAYALKSHKTEVDEITKQKAEAEKNLNALQENLEKVEARTFGKKVKAKKPDSRLVTA